MRIKGSSVTFFGAVICLAVLASASPAQAALILRLSDGVTTVQLSGSGVAVYNGAVGNFGVNVSTGVSKPVLGDASTAEMDLNSINIATTGPGTLTIELTDTDFGVFGAGSLAWLLGGTVTGGSVTAQAWKDLENREFGGGTLTTGLLGPYTGAFSSSGSLDHAAISDPYSMTLRFVFTASGAGKMFSGDFNLQNNSIPEPALTALLGVGLMALGLAMRRRTRG